MAEKEAFHQRRKTDDDHGSEMMTPSIQHQWPLLGKEIFALEHALMIAPGEGDRALTEQEKREQREKIHGDLLAELYRNEGNLSRDIRYLAFLLLRQGRGGAIVGNPLVLEQDGTKRELPYTGLEGYYAGSEKTSARPGMSREEILLEEANIGVQVLKNIKKNAIAQNAWRRVTRLKNVLDRKKDDVEALRWIGIVWCVVVRRLHVRVYQNPEFEPTLTERMEQVSQLLHELSGRTDEEKQTKANIQATYDRLKHEYESMSAEEHAQERQDRKVREWTRGDRLREFHHFQNETYQILSTSKEGQYLVRIQDASLGEATITETITLPETLDRNMYPPTIVRFTPEQREGYLALAQLGERGGDPLTRSSLITF